MPPPPPPLQWDPFVRELFEGTANYPGGSGTVFDYFLDTHRRVP